MSRKAIISIFAFVFFIASGSAFASGGISMITGGDAVTANDFTVNNIENGYSVSGQGVTVTIVNGLVTITKNNSVVRVGESVEVSGDIEARKIESPITGAGDSGVAASGGISMTPTALQNSVPNIQPSTVKDASFTGKFFRKIGIE